jgi:hypothetical protein
MGRIIETALIAEKQLTGLPGPPFFSQNFTVEFPLGLVQ